MARTWNDETCVPLTYLWCIVFDAVNSRRLTFGTFHPLKVKPKQPKQQAIASTAKYTGGWFQRSQAPSNISAANSGYYTKSEALSDLPVGSSILFPSSKLKTGGLDTFCYCTCVCFWNKLHYDMEPGTRSWLGRFEFALAGGVSQQPLFICFKTRPWYLLEISILRWQYARDPTIFWEGTCTRLKWPHQTNRS